jgi:hypothetical protein
MPITAQQARAELARRELERRSQQSTQQVLPEQVTQNPDVQLMANWLRNIPFGLGQRISSMASGQPLENIQKTLGAIPEPQSKSFGMAVGKALPDIAMATPFMRGAGLIPKIPGIAKTALGLGAYSGAKAAGQNQPVIPSALSGAATGAVFHGAGRLGATAIPKSIPGAERIGSALGGYVTGKALSPQDDKEAMFYGAMGGMFPSSKIQSIEPTKLAKSVVNYSLKPDKSSKKFGADPVEGIVKEGILGKNWQETGEKVQTRINELQDYKNRVKLDAKNNQARIDYTDVFNPLFELRNELLKDPKPHASIIKEIDTKIESLGKGINLRSLDIDTAFDLQSRVKRLEPTQFDRVSTKEVAKKLRQVYHSMGEAIKNNPQVSPELRTTLKRIHNLSAAQEAITDAKNRNSGVWNLIPMGMFGYGVMSHNPLIAGLVAGRAALKTPAVSTGISKIISSKYPKIPK